MLKKGGTCGQPSPVEVEKGDAVKESAVYRSSKGLLV